MQEAEVSALEIYNLLLAGKKLEMLFDTKQQAETFRIRIHHIKAAQEKHLLGLGMMLPSEVPTFSFMWQTDNAVTMEFIKQRPRKEYHVVILDEDGS